MKTILCRPVRAGFLLSTLVALLAFAARLAEAQPNAPNPPVAAAASPR
jgi:hypothetical protein